MSSCCRCVIIIFFILLLSNYCLRRPYLLFHTPVGAYAERTVDGISMLKSTEGILILPAKNHTEHIDVQIFDISYGISLKLNCKFLMFDILWNFYTFNTQSAFNYTVHPRFYLYYFNFQLTLLQRMSMCMASVDSGMGRYFVSWAASDSDFYDGASHIVLILVKWVPSCRDLQQPKSHLCSIKSWQSHGLSASLV